jgi:hypothetical protein
MLADAEKASTGQNLALKDGNPPLDPVALRTVRWPDAPTNRD